MAKGTVKWFNNAKGYGFIMPNEGDDDVFAHYSAINMEGYKTLKAGQEVNYDLVEGVKGLHASNITPTGHTAAPTASGDEAPSENTASDA